MPKAELGEKQLCPNCAAKFYDLTKRPAVCPKCGTSFDPGDEVVKLKRVKATRATAAAYEDDEEKPVVEPGDGTEDEVEETKELDAEGDETPTILDEDGDEEAPSPDALPEGFSEEEADLEEETADDGDAPMLDMDDDEEFSDDDLSLEDDEEEPR
ncbi:MAG: TIGR02300 family protein [Hyphomonadaceae bacterium]|nr:TIGR02300 family protein [Hyphomonadaceae bacterium]